MKLVFVFLVVAFVAFSIVSANADAQVSEDTQKKNMFGSGNPPPLPKDLSGSYFFPKMKKK